MKRSTPLVTYGASLSIKACRQFNLDITEVLEYALTDLGLRRFRLMTYWDECEAERGRYDFTALEELIAVIQSAGGEVSLCMGLRQPRWPECHPAEWTHHLSESDFNSSLYAFVAAAVKHFKDYSAVTSYQLENEALNRGIGRCSNFSRERLREEFALVKQLDSHTPILMSTSDSFGMPLRRPRPDMYGFSLYRHQWTERGLSRRHRPTLFHRIRAHLIRMIWHKPVICHELQLEPWGPRGTEQLSNEQQMELMDAEAMEEALRYAVDSGFNTIDMWGLEWWYWRKMAFEDAVPTQVIAKAVRESQ